MMHYQRPFFSAMMAVSLSRLVVPRNINSSIRSPIFASAFSTSIDAPSITKPKRIAIVGAGAVGSYYGGRLWEGLKADDDANVMFHLRNEHYDHCSKNGIDVSSYHGDFVIPPEELVAFPTTEDMAKSVVDGIVDRDEDEDGTFDWVVCALKSTSVSIYLGYCFLEILSC